MIAVIGKILFWMVATVAALILLGELCWQIRRALNRRKMP